MDTEQSKEYIFTKRTEDMPESADFCIILDDEAMKPHFPRGTKVYVSVSAQLKEFDAGVFYYDGKVFCRQWCIDYSGALLLLPSAPDAAGEIISIPPDKQNACLCLGKIITDFKLPKPSL